MVFLRCAKIHGDGRRTIRTDMMTNVNHYRHPVLFRVLFNLARVCICVRI